MDIKRKSKGKTIKKRKMKDGFVDMGEEALLGDESKLDEDIHVDWRGRPCNNNKHGGMRAAACILGLQAFEIMAAAAVGNNLITYVFNEMHFSLSKSANIVTNFMGTTFLLTLLGGFISDSYLGCFKTILIFGLVEFIGYILLSIQAHDPQLRPTQCNMVSDEGHCEEAQGFQAFTFFLALFLVGLGSGSIKPNIASHGADQFTKEDPNQSKKLSTYFNAGYFSCSIANVIALTFLVWIQTHMGMDIGFRISAIAMTLGLISLILGTCIYRNSIPHGNIFKTMAQVCVAAIRKRNQSHEPEILGGSPYGNTSFASGYSSGSEYLHGSQKSSFASVYSSGSEHLRTEKFRLLDKASFRTQDGDGDGEGNELEEGPWRLCTIEQVEQVKIIISVVPIFACTIFFNTILAQLQTFSVHQGNAMDTRLTKTFHIPPASLQSIPYFMLIFLVPLYETAFVPIAKKFTKNPSGITTLQRIGVGLFLGTFSMVSAAVLEKKRRTSDVELGKRLSIFWMAPQFLIFGLAEMFTAVGVVEFFYKQSLGRMQSFLTAMGYCSSSLGFYLSSLLVSLVNKISSLSSTSSQGWLTNNDLNKDRLDLFYWLLAALSFINFLHFIFWAKWYSCHPSLLTTPPPAPPSDSCGDESVIP